MSEYTVVVVEDVSAGRGGGRGAVCKELGFVMCGITKTLLRV